MPRTTTRTALKSVTLDEVSFVGKGDNKGAHIMLLKSHPSHIVALGKSYAGDNKEAILKHWAEKEVGKVDGVLKEESVAMFNDLLTEKTIRDKVWGMVWVLEDSIRAIMESESGEDKKALLETTVEQFKTAITGLTKNKGGANDVTELEKAQAELAKAQKALAALTKQVESLTKERDEAIAKQAPTPASVIKMEDLPEPVRKQMEAQEALLKSQQTSIEKMQDEAVSAQSITKASLIPSISADGVVVADVLKALQKKAPEEAASVFTLLKAADARIQAGGLFKEVGAGNVNNSGATAYEQLLAKAEELRKTETKLTKEQAFAKVFNSEHDLRKQYNAER